MKQQKDKEAAIMIKTPECDKLADIRSESQLLGEFLAWLPSQNIFLCDCNREGFSNDTLYVPTLMNIEKLLATYFNIDLEKVELEKRQLLEALRSASHNRENLHAPK